MYGQQNIKILVKCPILCFCLNLREFLTTRSLCEWNCFVQFSFFISL